MKTPKVFLLVFILLLPCISTFAQFTLSAEIRPRGEFRKGFKVLPDENSDPALFVSQRSRINFTYKNEKINTKISFYDVRVWGDETYKTDVPSMGLHEAWAEILLCDSLSLRAGKQEICYDNKRFIDNGGWTQMGTTHNAATLKYKSSGFQIDFSAAFNQKAENNFGTDYSGVKYTYKTLNILWLSKKISEDLKLSLLNIADGYQKEETTNTTYLRGTFGGIVDYKKNDKFSATLRAFCQTGRLQNGQQIAAYYGNAEFSYLLKEKFTILLGLDYISGKDAKDTANKKSNSFNMLYGSAHSFNGNMEYFSTFLKDKDAPGLVNPYLNLILKLGEKSKLRADFHYFFLQNNYLINGDPVKKALGAEADLSYSYEISKDATVLTGFSVMNPTPQMEIFSGGNSGYYGTWGFVMLTVKPTLFKSEKK